MTNHIHSTEPSLMGNAIVRDLIDQAERAHTCIIDYAFIEHNGTKVVTEITITPRFLPLGFQEQVMDYIREDLPGCEFECTWWEKTTDMNGNKLYKQIDFKNG